MNRKSAYLVYVLAAALTACSAPAAAAPTVPTSLHTCQNAVKTATTAFVKHKIAAVAACLQAVSTQIVMNNAAGAGAAAATCVTQFRKIHDSRGLNKQLSDTLATAIVRKCAPGKPSVTHTLADILGPGAGVPQPLGVGNLNAWCTRFGGDGSIDTLPEWIDCIAAAAECDVDSTITSQYPRALEWLALVRTQMAHPPLPAPPATDASRISDAVAGLDLVKAAIDGPNNDNAPSIQCGGYAPPATCGNGMKDAATEQCDGSDLAGQSCSSLGFTGGTLACNLTCGFNLDGCSGTGQLMAATGQTSAYTADKNDGVAAAVAVADDGSVRAGAPSAFVDNGDGTITDLNTSLVWEKKGHAGDLHDYTNAYRWNGDGTQETIWDWLDDVNAEGGTGFAGHNDWRIPNIKELRSLIDYQQSFPAVNAAFNSLCASGCGVRACSCTNISAYWSSSTATAFPYVAWYVNFNLGDVNEEYKGYYLFYVRAVRGGS